MIVQLPGIQPEIAIQAIPDDERVWVPQAPGGLVPAAAAEHGDRQLVQPAARAQVGRAVAPHPSVVGHGLRHQGAWRYLEHDWIAREGAFVYEPPGEIHTLVVDELTGAGEMITLFNIHGAMVYVDEAGEVTGYEDVFTKIAMCRKHYAACGLGEAYVDALVR